jgi:hypothetical protein
MPSVEGIEYMPGTPAEEPGVKPPDEEAQGIRGTRDAVAWGGRKVPDCDIKGVTEVVEGAIRY